MKSRPPALDLAADPSQSTQTSYVINSDGGVKKLDDLDPKSPPLPTPPLAKKESDTAADFQVEMEKALEKVGTLDSNKSPDNEKKPLLEVCLPVGLP
jgi:hypothetical protein